MDYQSFLAKKLTIDQPTGIPDPHRWHTGERCQLHTLIRRATITNPSSISLAIRKYLWKVIVHDTF
jgi:hypothetical protein